MARKNAPKQAEFEQNCGKGQIFSILPLHTRTLFRVKSIRAALLLIFCSGILQVHGQAAGKAKLDSLLNALSKAAQDTNRVNLLNDISYFYAYVNPDSGILYAKESIDLAEKLSSNKQLAEAHNSLGINYQSKSDYINALDHHFQALKLREELGNKTDAGTSLSNIGIIYDNQHNYPKALEYYRKAMEIFKEAHYKKGFATALGNIGLVYYSMNDFPKAGMFIREAIKLEEELGDSGAINIFLGNLGNIYLAESDYEKALECDTKALNQYKASGDRGGEAINLCNIGEIYYQIAKDNNVPLLDKFFKGSKTKALDAAASNLELADKIFGELNYLAGIQETSKYLSRVSELQGNAAKALAYLRKENAYRDSIFNDENRSRMESLEKERDQDLRQKEIEIQKLQLDKAQNERYYFIGGILLLLLLIFVLYNRFRLKQRISEQLQNSLERIRQTQAQLVEQEKLASLGQLTSGIAHEIQNPLNFVNNFSEVSSELVDELMNEEDLETRKQIAEDIKKNLSIIHQHGKRADGIVKGMLMHSRGGKGEKQMTDINALIGETLNLSFHAMRAKHPGFNCEIVTQFAHELPEININQLDISRVVLNLLNNAFYAVKEGRGSESKALPSKVTLSTRLVNSEKGDSIVITIRDNGQGIPQQIITNIFTPFFTTKPGSEGTGLGLSISRDIIKAHGGDIRVGSEVGKYTEFVINLPLQA